MHPLRNKIVFWLLAIMLVALFVSRAALSITLVLFAVTALANKDLKRTLVAFSNTPLLIGISLLFLFPLLSGLWSSDVGSWADAMLLKAPLLMFPLAFAGNFNFSKKQWLQLGALFIGLVVAGSIWSISHYLKEPALIEQGYLRSQTLPTPLENDHVRYSWLVALALPLLILLILKSNSDLLKFFCIVTAGWLVVYLHILSARTGLLALYVMVVAFIIWFMLKKAKPIVSFALLAALIAIPIIAYSFLPTFRNRIKFVRYDYGYMKDGHYLPGGNDATRVISFIAGWELMFEKPLTGHGYGDIRRATADWYAREYPMVKEEERIIPSSQFLVFGVGCGVPGFIVVCIALILPWFTKIRHRFAWCALNLAIAFPFLYDIGLEVQYGVFIYCISVLLSWKWFINDGKKG